jgi:hypothetical protein
MNIFDHILIGPEFLASSESSTAASIVAGATASVAHMASLASDLASVVTVDL